MERSISDLELILIPRRGGAGLGVERSVSGLGIKGLLRRGGRWAGGGKIRLGPGNKRSFKERRLEVERSFSGQKTEFGARQTARLVARPPSLRSSMVSA